LDKFINQHIKTISMRMYEIPKEYYIQGYVQGVDKDKYGENLSFIAVDLDKVDTITISFGYTTNQQGCHVLFYSVKLWMDNTNFVIYQTNSLSDAQKFYENFKRDYLS